MTSQFFYWASILLDSRVSSFYLICRLWVLCWMCHSNISNPKFGSKQPVRAPIRNGPTSRTSTNKQIRDSPMRVSRPLRELIQIWDNMPNQHPPDLPSAPPHGTSFSPMQTHHTRECHLIDRFDPASGYPTIPQEGDRHWVGVQIT